MFFFNDVSEIVTDKFHTMTIFVAEQDCKPILLSSYFPTSKMVKMCSENSSTKKQRSFLLLPLTKRSHIATFRIKYQEPSQAMIIKNRYKIKAH